MRKIIEYNFPNTITPETDWVDFFSKKRRDSNFAAVLEVAENDYLAIRDHIGTVPLYYKINGKNVSWSLNFSDLLDSDDLIDEEAVRNYMGFSTAKVTKLTKKIWSVPPGTVMRITNSNPQTLFCYKMSIERTDLSYADTVRHVKLLLEQAVERIIKQDRVGLYLSGGMDSGLLAKILNGKGVQVQAYTALPSGMGSPEYHFSKINAEISKVSQHYFTDVKPDRYNKYLDLHNNLYKTPNGSATTINVISLWEGTDIGTENQVFYAQNTDTLTSSVAAQSHTAIVSLLPSSIRNFFVDMPYTSAISNYLYFCTRGRIKNHEYEEYIGNGSLSSKLAQAGMYIAHSPIDGESINAPSIASGKLASNPYYDIDLIEFYLGIPERYKIGFDLKSKTIFSYEKKVLRDVALEYLPAELVYRKKGFNLPKKRDLRAVDFYSNLKQSLNGVSAKNTEEKMSLEILSRYFK